MTQFVVIHGFGHLFDPQKRLKADTNGYSFMSTYGSGFAFWQNVDFIHAKTVQP